MTLYAIGDIHGQKTKLEDTLALIDRDGGAQAQVVFLGDYVDRGPDSRGVLNTLIDGQAEGRNWTCLRGNHDRLFQNFVEQGTNYDPNVKSGLPWLHARLGGIETLRSYGISVPDIDVTSPDEDLVPDLVDAAKVAVPQDHLQFLDGLQPYAERGNWLFVHAGIRPGVALDKQVEADLCWIRADFLEDTRRHPWIVIHGHTAVEVAEHRGNRVNLDSGAGYGRDLTAAVFEGRDCWTLGPDGRIPLRP
jgi:serine/threonine protein phosphatase 1